MRPSQSLRLHRDQVLQLAKQHHVLQLRVFGSAVRGDDSEESDLDLLADFDDQATLFDAFALQEELESLLQLKVDLASQAGLHPLIREAVMKEARSLFMSETMFIPQLENIACHLGLAKS